MHKPSPSRISIISSIAASIGIMDAVQSTAQVFQRQRGKAPVGYKWTSGVYVPGGERPNVEPTRIRNPKIAANVQMMHEKWLAAFNERQARKRAANA